MSDSLAVFIKGKGGNLNPMLFIKNEICQSSLSAQLRYPVLCTFVEIDLEMISTVIHVKQQTKTSKHLTVQGIMSYLDFIYHKYIDTLNAF